MEPITINNLTFAYPGQEPLFNHCDLNISSDWKLGLLGRNGRGKSNFPFKEVFKPILSLTIIH